MSGVDGNIRVVIMRDDEAVSPVAITAASGTISAKAIVSCKESQKVYVKVQLDKHR